MKKESKNKYWEYGPKYVLPAAKGGTNSPKNETDLQVYYHHDTIKEFSEEEIIEANNKEKIHNLECLEKVKEDGFIKIPIFFKDTNGVLQELESWVPPTFEPSCSKGFYEKYGMYYNIYVPSYKRSENNLTAKMLTRFKVKNWYFAVDPSQYEDYKAKWGSEHIIIRDIRFRDPSMIDLATSIKRPNTFSGTAGIYNNLLSFSKSLGEEKYWTMDDDFLGLAMKIRKGDQNVQPGEIYDKDNYYRCSNIFTEYGFNFQKFMNGIEKMGQSTRNHGFLGLEKFGVVFSLCTAWKLGTRVYSFYLSDNKTQPTHLGAMNNDIITSLEQSKHGLPTGLLEIIGYNSAATQSGGGLTEQYKLLGTLEKGKILAKTQPNYSKISVNFNRVHHTVDFTSYNKQRLFGSPKKDEITF